MSGTGCILTAGEREALPAVMRGRGAGAPRCGARTRRWRPVTETASARSAGSSIPVPTRCAAGRLAARVPPDRPGPGGPGGVSGAWGKAGAGPGGVAPGDAAGQPRGASGVRDTIPPGFGQGYARGGAMGPTHRPGSGHVRPEPLPGQADRAAREAFMRKCGRTVRDAPPDGAAVLPDAAHPGWQGRPAHGRVLRSDRPAVRSTTGRRRPDPHGAPDPGTVEPAAGGGGRTGATTAPRLPGNRSAPVPAAG